MMNNLAYLLKELTQILRNSIFFCRITPWILVKVISGLIGLIISDLGRIVSACPTSCANFFDVSLFTAATKPSNSERTPGIGELIPGGWRFVYRFRQGMYCDHYLLHFEKLQQNKATYPRDPCNSRWIRCNSRRSGSRPWSTGERRPCAPKLIELKFWPYIEYAINVRLW